MDKDVRWTVTVDKVTNALVRSYLAKSDALTTLDAFVIHAVERELDRLALLEHELARARPLRTEDMWEIVIPLPPRR